MLIGEITSTLSSWGINIRHPYDQYVEWGNNINFIFMRDQHSPPLWPICWMGRVVTSILSSWGIEIRKAGHQLRANVPRKAANMLKPPTTMALWIIQGNWAIKSHLRLWSTEAAELQRVGGPWAGPWAGLNGDHGEIVAEQREFTSLDIEHVLFIGHIQNIIYINLTLYNWFC